MLNNSETINSLANSESLDSKETYEKVICDIEKKEKELESEINTIIKNDVKELGNNNFFNKINNVIDKFDQIDFKGTGYKAVSALSILLASSCSPALESKTNDLLNEINTKVGIYAADFLSDIELLKEKNPDKQIIEEPALDLKERSLRLKAIKPGIEQYKEPGEKLPLNNAPEEIDTIIESEVEQNFEYVLSTAKFTPSEY